MRRSVFIASACFDRIVSNRVKDTCISLINEFSCVLFANIFDVLILFLVAWEAGASGHNIGAECAKNLAAGREMKRRIQP